MSFVCQTVSTLYIILGMYKFDVSTTYARKETAIVVFSASQRPSIESNIIFKYQGGGRFVDSFLLSGHP